jgi:hypothetical protein
LQNSLNKGVIYQNRHNKGLNPKNERFCPVFVGKILQIKELLARFKELSPDLWTCFASGSILSSGLKLMGRLLVSFK